MYFSSYKTDRKKVFLKNRLSRKKKGLFGGILRFIKLTAIIVSIIPLLYLADKVYGFINRTLDFSHFENYLRIKTVKVSGNHFVAEDEFSRDLQEIRENNILQVDMKGIVSSMKKHRWIKDVSVRRELPDTLLVEISERTPSLYVNSHGKLFLADEEGIILDDMRKEDLLGLPVVYGVELPENRSRNSSPVRALLPAIEAKKEIASIPWIDLASTGIEVQEKDQIVLHVKGCRIKLGRGDYQEKLHRFYNVTRNLEDKGISYKEVDLRFGNDVIVKTMKII